MGTVGARGTAEATGRTASVESVAFVAPGASRFDATSQDDCSRGCFDSGPAVDASAFG